MSFQDWTLRAFCKVCKSHYNAKYESDDESFADAAAVLRRMGWHSCPYIKKGGNK